MTWAENVKHSRHKEIRGKGYEKYDNFDAIEVPFTDAIPGDYEANRPRERVNVNVNNWGRHRNVLLRIFHSPFHMA